VGADIPNVAQLMLGAGALVVAVFALVTLLTFVGAR